jgi:predicted phosphodiesterase
MGMRIAVISDIHGNDHAFAAVVDDIETLGVDRIVCLGDAVQGGAQPAEVIQRLRTLDCPVVLGNADDILLHGTESEDAEPMTAAQEAVRTWQLGKLSAEDLLFIAEFPRTVEVPLPNGKRLLCGHGSPRSFNHVILPAVPDDEVRAMLGPIDNAIVCGGHTHLHQIRQLGDNFFFNPGSIALPDRRDLLGRGRKVNRWAEYAILTVEASGLETLELRRVPYGIEAMLASIEACGMPDAHLLADFYRV